MTKRRVTKASKRRLLFFGSICILVISYFIINSVTMLLDIKKLSTEQQTLQNNLSSLQEDEINLNKELSKLKNDEYKARYAREYFLYSKEEGEYIFATILEENEKTVEEEQPQYNLYQYIIAAVIILLLLVILFILKRLRRMNKKV